MAAIKKLRDSYPSYFKDLTDEEILAGKAADAYKRLTDEIINSAKARAIEKKIQQLQEENVNLEDDIEDRKKWNREHESEYIIEKGKADQATNEAVTQETVGMGTKMGYVNSRSRYNGQLIGKYQGNQQQINANNARIEENNARIQRLAGQSAALQPESPGALEQDARDKEEEKRRRAEEAARRKALRAEMREEQDKAKAIIDNVLPVPAWIQSFRRNSWTV